MVLDIETTGLDIDRAAIIEVGAILVSKGAVKQEYTSFVSHDGPLPDSIKRITGITDAMLEGAPPVQEVISELQKFIGKYPVVAHNGFSFDFRILEREGLKLEDKFDSMEFAFFVLPTSVGGHNTASLSARFELGKVPHRALPDCKVELAIIEKLQEEWKKRSKKKAAALKFLALQTAWWWAQFLPGAEESVNDITSWVEAHVPYRKKDPEQEKLALQTSSINLEKVEGFFKPGSEGNLQYAEDRPEQREMARVIAESFNNRKHAVIEAGTGVGKSKAYLVPSILFAIENGIPVTISTYTKALQDQLSVKEIPHVRNTVKPDLRVAVVKGKQNYVCLKKFADFADEALKELKQRSLYKHGKDDTEYTTRLAFLLLSSWLLETERGDWEELPYWLTENIPKRVMQDICNLDELCARDVCEQYDEDRCFLAKARLRAKDADLVILNHAILLTGIRKKLAAPDSPVSEEENETPPDATYSHPILPSEAKFVVLDEAHHLEDAATSAWTLSVSQAHMERLLRQLFDERKGARPIMDAVAGATMSKRLLDLGLEYDAIEKNLQLDIKTLFEEILAKILPHNPSAKWTAHLSFTELAKTPEHMEPLTNILGQIEARLLTISSILSDFAKRAVNEKHAKSLGIRSELAGRVANAVNKLLGTDTYFIRYIERDRHGVMLHAAPLSIAREVKDLVYDNFNSVVLTSATITVGDGADRFNFFAERCGTSLIDKGGVQYMQRPSSFDYEKQVKFFVPKGISYASGALEKKKHAEQSLAFLKEALLASQGGALILCSSHEQVEQLYAGLKETLAASNIWLLRQSKDKSISSVVRDFMNDVNSVLIGTSSLWQGVDVPGPSLRSLFIYKIPYRNFGEPIITARRTDLDSRGKDSYGGYYEPLAALDLKQGFGRLIRKKTDIGIAVLLDEKIMTKNRLLKSFPPGVHIEPKTPAEIMAALAELAKLTTSSLAEAEAVASPEKPMPTISAVLE